MLKNAMEVLSLFSKDRKEMGVLEAAELLGRPKSTVSRWLSAMKRTDFLERDSSSGLYRVSLRLAAIGELTRQATSLQQTAYPALQRITAATGETSNLVLLDGNEGRNVEAVTSPRSVMHLGAVGKRFPLHASAAGKALLAGLSEADIRALTPPPLSRYTRTTITDFGALLSEVTAVRSNGYAVNWKEFEPDLVGVGAPVRNHRGDVIAALSISAPASRMSRAHLPITGGHVAEAAETLSETFGYRGSDH